MNKVILIGRLVKDVELKETKSKKKVCQFDLAVQRKFKDAEGNYLTDFLKCIAWEKTAEYMNTYLTKGQKILVEGRFETREYERKDKTKATAYEVIVEAIEPIESKKTNEAKETKEDLPFN